MKLWNNKNFWAVMALSFMSLGTARSQDKNLTDDRNVKKFETHHTKINIDSLENLNTKERNDYIKSARKRPTLFQIDTVKVGEKLNYSGIYINSLNLIRLNYILVDSVYRARAKNDNDRDAQIKVGVADINNSRLFETAIHELKHAKDYKNFNPIAMSADQMTQRNLHSEIVARIAVLIDSNRDTYIKTGDVEQAFKNAWLPERKDLEDKFLKEFYPTKWENPFSKTFDHDSKSTESPLYGSYIKENPNLTKDISQQEAQIILYTALDMIKNSLTSYKNQFSNMTVDGIDNISVFALADLRDSLNNNIDYKIKGFNKQIKEMYDFQVNGKTVNLLDLGGQDSKEYLLKTVNEILSDKDIKANIKSIKKDKKNIL